MSILTRGEFNEMLCNLRFADLNELADEERNQRHNDVVAAYDAALARIAELERHITGLHCNAIEAMLPTIPKVPEMIGLESSSLFPEEK